MRARAMCVLCVQNCFSFNQTLSHAFYGNHYHPFFFQPTDFEAVYSFFAVTVQHGALQWHPYWDMKVSGGGLASQI